MAFPIKTVEQLERAGDIGRCELVCGELIMMMPPGGRHGRLANLIAHALTGFVEARGLGTILAETGFVLARDPDTLRAPDVAFVRGDRAIGDGFIDGAPNLAVEVVSPGDRPGQVSDKVAEWLEAGAEAVWLVDPRARTVTVHDGARPKVLEETDTLDGGGVLPGFRLDLGEFFV